MLLAENLRSARCSQGKFDHCSCSQNKTQCSHARKCSQRPFDTPIMVEGFPWFDLGFDFLNTDKSNKGGESQDEGNVTKKKRLAELREAERNQL